MKSVLREERVDIENLPLHVRVAEVLGWTGLEPCGDILIPQASGWHGYPPGMVPVIGAVAQGRVRVPRFDLEWDATGPLIEKYVEYLLHPVPERWQADGYGPVHPAGMRPTPLVNIDWNVYIPHTGWTAAVRRRHGDMSESRG